VVIGYLNIMGVAFAPNKTDTPLVVDPNAVLSGAVSPQLFQPVSRQRRQNPEIVRAIENVQLAQRRSLDGPKPATGMAKEEPLGFRRAKGLDHPGMLYRISLAVKQYDEVNEKVWPGR